MYVSCHYILFEDSNRIMIYTCLTSRKKKNVQYIGVEFIFIYIFVCNHRKIAFTSQVKLSLPRR